MTPKTIADAPRPLNTNDKAMWVLGYNEAQERLAPELERTQQALDMLAGLHPCLTTDDPAEMAKQIFDAVMSERSAHAQEVTNWARNLDFRDELIARWRAGMRELIPQRMGAEAIRERLQSLLAGPA